MKVCKTNDKMSNRCTRNIRSYKHNEKNNNKNIKYKPTKQLYKLRQYSLHNPLLHSADSVFINFCISVCNVKVFFYDNGFSSL